MMVCCCGADPDSPVLQPGPSSTPLQVSMFALLNPLAEHGVDVVAIVRAGEND